MNQRAITGLLLVLACSTASATDRLRPWSAADAGWAHRPEPPLSYGRRQRAEHAEVPVGDANVVHNGSFESPAQAPGGYTRLFAPAALDGWTVAEGSVDVVGTYWQAGSGSQSVDLSGAPGSAGLIYQDVPTIPGQRYRLTFQIAADVQGPPNVKLLQVLWDGGIVANPTFDQAGKTETAMGWTTASVSDLVASGPTTRLAFLDLTGSGYGATLDDVRVVPANDGPLSLVENGGFESPLQAPGQYSRLFAPTTFDGWTVAAGSVDLVGTYWQAAEGTQSVDLSGAEGSAGLIYQDVPTTPGQHYAVSFQLAADVQGPPTMKSFQVWWNGAPIETFTVDQTGRTETSMRWEPRTLSGLAATSTTTRLAFLDLTASGYGAALDAVSVIPDDPPNLVHNGSFERPVQADGAYSRLFGPTSFDGWTVATGSVDLVGTYWEAGDGTQSVDLSGAEGSAGLLYQDLATVPEHRYTVSFLLAADVQGPPSVKTFQVLWDGVVVDMPTFDQTGKTETDMGWTRRSIPGLRASTATTRLAFLDLTASGYGAAIDDVRVVAVDEPLLTPEIVWPAPASIAYGAALGANQLNAAASIPGTFTYSPVEGSRLPAGVAALSATFVPNDPAYASVTVTRTLTVTRAPLLVVPDDRSKLLAAPDPPFTYAFAGLLNGDTPDAITGVPQIVANSTGVGQFPIIVSRGTLSAANYDFSFGAATLTVVYAGAGTCLGQPGHAVLAPVDQDGGSVFKQKSTVAVKFRVCDARGSSVGTPGVVAAFQLRQVLNGTVAIDVNEAVESKNADASFRWDAASQQWTFTLSTKPLEAAKTYLYRISLNDSTSIDFRFGLR